MARKAKVVRVQNVRGLGKKYIAHLTSSSHARQKHRLFGFLHDCGFQLSRVSRIRIPEEGAGTPAERVRQLQESTRHEINPGHILQSLLVKAERKDKQGYEYFVLVLPWNKRFNSKKVQQRVGSQVSFVQRDNVRSLTGYPLGEVGPIPLSQTPIKY
jgi:hypothetical protein